MRINTDIDRNRLKVGLLLAGVVGFAVLGQHYLLHRRDYVWDGIIFFGLALFCFAWLMRVKQQRPSAHRASPSPIWRERARRLLLRRQTALAGLALLLNWIAARSANTQPPPHDYTLSVVLWLTSLTLFFIAFIPSLRITHHASRITHHASRFTFHTELALVFSLLLIGLVLRVWNLEYIPANLSGDEGTQGLWAVDALNGQLRNPFATGWFTVPTMSFFAQAASLRLFGDSVAGLRTLSALIGTATLVFTYLLVRQELGRRVALFALAALTFNHYHIHFSRLGSNQIADPLFMTLTLWLLTAGLRQETNQSTSKQTYLLLGAGLTMGLSWYGYFGSRVILLVVVAYLGTQALAERGCLRRNARALTLMLLLALMAASPLLLYYANHPENLSARWNQVSFFRWLENELARPEHDSTFNLVVQQVWRSISAFNHTLDPTFWYRAQMPLLDFVSGILFILGLAVAASQWRRAAARLILLWFGLALTLGWILTENPPSSMRMVIITPAVASLVALGLDRLLTLAQWVAGRRRAVWNAAGLSLLALIAILNVHYYFIVYTPTRVYGNPTAETSTELARHLNNRDDNPFVYFYGPPFLYFDFGTIRFIARDARGVSVPPKDQEPNYPTQVTRPTLFVVLRERLDELTEIKTQYPNGSLDEFYAPSNRRLMFVIYEVLP